MAISLASATLIYVLASLHTAHQLVEASVSVSETSPAPQVRPRVSNPLTYTRLRNEQYYNPIWRNLQLKNPHEEQRVELRVNGTGSGSPTIHSYYVNPSIDKNNITEDDLIFESLHQLFLARFTQVYSEDFDRPEDRFRAADPEKVSPELCKRELDFVMAKLDVIQTARAQHQAYRGIDPELATFLDSIATEETGLLLGHFYWLGNWAQCSERHMVDVSNNGSQVVSFTGRYCVASLRSPDWEARIDSRARILRDTYFKEPHHEQHYRKMFRIQLGMCLPESCDSTLFLTRANDLKRLATFKIREPYVNYNLTEFYCIPDEGSPLRKFDYPTLMLLASGGLWLTSMLIATFVDYTDDLKLSEIRKDPRSAQKTGAQKLVLALSLIESYRTLTHFRAPKNSTSGNEGTACRGEATGGHLKEAPGESKISSSDLSFLNAIKVIVMPFIIYGHVGLMILMMCSRPLQLDNEERFLFHLQASSTMWVDWYFCYTALTLTYVMFSSKMVYKNNLFTWIYSVFHRYWRLMPGYLVLFWFGRSLYKYTGKGPLWDYGTSDLGLRAVCERESWWSAIFMAQNFHPLHEECIMTAWYLASDIQFYLITPFLLVLLSKSAKLGYAVSISLMAASMSGRAYVFMTYPRVQSYDMVRMQPDITMRTNWDMHFVYMRPYYRITSWLVGILAGHYCYMVRSGKWTSVLYNSKSRAGKWLISTLAWAAVVMTIAQNFFSLLADLLVPRSLDPHVRVIATLYQSTHHFTSSTVAATVAIVILFGHWPRLRTLMEHRVWVYLSRINYFVLLYQVEVLVWLYQLSERLPEASSQETVRILILTMVILYSNAFLATLVLGNPLARLESEFIGASLMRARRPQQSAPEATPLGLVRNQDPSGNGDVKA